MVKVQKALKTAYQSLLPYSLKYRVDFARYLFSLKILQSLPDFKQKKFLDIGTGIGILPLALTNLGADASGLDYYIFPESSNEMFQIKEMDNLSQIWKNHNLKIYNQNINDTTFYAEIPSMDVVISEAIIEHLKNPKIIFSLAHKILKPGGYLLITTPNISTLLKRIRFFFGLSPNWPIKEFFEAGEQFTGHWREYTKRELKTMCEKSDFEIVKQYNKNVLANFKGLKNWRKNIRTLITRISWLVPNGREMLYVLCRKKS